MQSIRSILHKRTSHPYTPIRTSAKANSSRKLILVYRKKLPSNTWYNITMKMTVAFANIFMNKVETKILSQSALKMVYKYNQRQNRTVHQSPSYNRLHGWKFLQGNNIPGHLHRQRSNIRKRHNL